MSAGMKTILHILVMGAFACTISACGYKGKLKSPTQIEAAEAKKAKKQEKQEKQERKAAESKSVATGKTPGDAPASDSADQVTEEQ